MRRVAFSSSYHGIFKDRNTILSSCASPTQSPSSRKLVEGDEWRPGSGGQASTEQVDDGMPPLPCGTGMCVVEKGSGEGGELVWAWNS